MRGAPLVVMLPAIRSLLGGLLGLAACGSSTAPSTAAPRIASALAATLTEADRAHAPWRCTAEDLPELATATIGAWQVAHNTLSHAAASQLVIGVVADAGGADPKTLAALGRLRAKLDDQKADLVLALGGMGVTQRELEATLTVLARPSSPVVALPGDLESVTAQTAAIAALATKGAAVLDGRLVRWIELPSLTIGTVAGIGTAGPDGCTWQPEDVLQLYQELAARPGLRIAALAGAPREMVTGEATGDVALVPGPAIDVVVHGPTRPAPSAAQSGGRDGARITLSPGTADASPRLPETRAPSAALLIIKGSTWTWRPLIEKP
jgi:hypothetical protein